MPKSKNIPSGNTESAAHAVRTSAQLGELIRARRVQLDLRQLDLAGLGNTGNRFIVELENGKPTVQLQKVLDTLELLGLEVIVRPKSARPA